MPFQVYVVQSGDRAKLDAALADDILSRQSIAVKDARHFGRTGSDVFVFVDGTEAGILRADALLLDFASRAPDADALHAQLAAEDDEAASSLGAIFE